MSALRHKRTFALQKVMSALPPKAGCPLSAKSGHGSHVMCAQTSVTKERLPPEANQVEQGLFCCFDE